MVIGQGTTRVALWGLSAAGAAGVSGIGWAGEPVEIPLIWLGVLTFVPTSDLIDVARSQLNKLKATSRKG